MIPHCKIITENKLYKYISKDDVERLQEYMGEEISVDYVFSKYHFAQDQIMHQCPSLLATAAFLGSINTFRFLVANGADMNVRDKANLSIANFAVAGGNMEIMNILDDSGISFDNSLFIAAERGLFDVFMWLYATKYPDLTIRKKDSTTLLHSAVKSGNSKLINFLLDTIRDDLELSDIMLLMQMKQEENESSDSSYSDYETTTSSL